ncbi:MAG: phosphoribosylglycinamide formyltransferase [Deltaproteobacteria bacterium]|jgi:phosphoribosylglycinamide formyltransferase-1|nr:phosphoribosylglycinamide formyltransferase [Deltaproteobacteria bacterium]MCL5879360.1 phosphoribosylglycinamide formyltransferase [Deltaproteobacteria bacterium]MDA8304555.1 phosphoribosylglycinamide formyltransferase [Deltaproteobacteria bacterium]
MTLNKINPGDKKNCIILASGNGSNALNIINYFSAGGKNKGINIVAVVSNAEFAPVIEKVKKIAPFIPVFVIPFNNLSEREIFEGELEKIIKKYGVELIILAGFMKVLSKEFVSKFSYKIINVHPSLLPSFKGKDAIKKAYDYGVKYTGVTIHYVTEEVDSGPIILQEVVKIEEGDTIESLEAKIHKIEHKIYPIALELLANKAHKAG